METNVFHMSVQGYNHIKHNKTCQDASISYLDDQMSIAIICDGHGGDDYMRSDQGSKLAANIALECIKKFVQNTDIDSLIANKKDSIDQLKSTIIAEWRQAVEKHEEMNSFRISELEKVSQKSWSRYLKKERIHRAYVTTLIAVVLTKDYWIGMQIGDGRCVAMTPDGEFKQPVPIDSKCFLNATTSMCDSDAIQSFHHFFSEKLPIAVFVGSDGVEDSFQNDEQLHNLYKTIIYSFATNEFDKAKEDLYNYLPRLSEKGSGDDISISGILDISMLKELNFVKDYNIEEEKAKVAKKIEDVSVENKKEVEVSQNNNL